MFKCSECVWFLHFILQLFFFFFWVKFSLCWMFKYTEYLQCIWLLYFILQPMLDVPIYGRIATLELFRPHVSFLCWKAIMFGKRVIFSFLFARLASFFFIWCFYFCFISTLSLCRVKHRIFYLLLQKDTNFVFFNGTQRHLSLSQGYFL